MPFLNEITIFINQTLKAGSLNRIKLQPGKLFSISTVVARKKDAAQKELELLPAIVDANRKTIPITPDSKLAIQIYHKLLANAYSYEKKSYGDGHFIKSTSDMAMVVISNSKMTDKTKDYLESVILFGMPQKLSAALLAALKINNCLITPVSSNMDTVQVFKQEYPQSAYFLNEQVSMFLIRYKIEMTFSQACVDYCNCSDTPVPGTSQNIITEPGENILTEDGQIIIIE
jgi:hypothetical protein